MPQISSSSLPVLLSLVVARFILFGPQPCLGQKSEVTLDGDPPAEIELFARGLISTDLGERDASFHPNGEEFYFTLWTNGFGTIMVSYKVDERWGKPETASFSGHYNDLEAFVAPDGGRLFFASKRPLENGGEPADFNLWLVKRMGDGWSEALPVAEINTDIDEYYPSVDLSGTLYWTAAYEGSFGGEDLYFAVPTDSGFSEPENVGPRVNTEHDEFNAMISPDGSWLAFGSFGREDGFGGGDLYVSFRQPDGTFGAARNMGQEVNSSALDFCPALTPDGRGFLFSSRRSTLEPVSREKRTYEGLSNSLHDTGNGRSDIFWIDARFIETLRGSSSDQ